MKKSGIISLVVMVLMAGVSSAEISEAKDSEEFNIKKLEGSAVPRKIDGDLKDWNLISVDDNDCYDIVQDGENGFAGFGGKFRKTTGWTFEMRFKVIEDAASGPTLNVILGDGAVYYAFGLNTAEIKDHYGAKVQADLTGDFHVLRVAQEAKGGDQRVYLDGKEWIGFTLTSGKSDRNVMWVGDASAATIAGGHVLVDYIRADTTGAYMPVP